MKRSIVAAVSTGAVIVLVLLAIVGWQLHWFLAESSTNHRAVINNDGYNRQTSLVEDIHDKVLDATSNIPANQRIAIVAIVCDDYSKLTDPFRARLDVPTQQFINQECPT